MKNAINKDELYLQRIAIAKISEFSVFGRDLDGCRSIPMTSIPEMEKTSIESEFLHKLFRR
jgi:hypothetical protein